MNCTFMNPASSNWLVQWGQWIRVRKVIATFIGPISIYSEKLDFFQHHLTATVQSQGFICGIIWQKYGSLDRHLCPIIISRVWRQSYIQCWDTGDLESGYTGGMASIGKYCNCNYQKSSKMPSTNIIYLNYCKRHVICEIGVYSDVNGSPTTT